MTKTMSVDLDGVLNIYNGIYEENKIAPIKEGAKEFLEELSKNYKVEIFTVRNSNLVIEWLNENNIAQYVSSITNVKNPYTSVFVDDRALTFNGNFYEVLEKIKVFKPYWKIV